MYSATQKYITMSKKFSERDRVVVFGIHGRITATVLTNEDASGLILFKPDEGQVWTGPTIAHKRQLKRLKTRKVWIAPLDINSRSAQVCVSYVKKTGWREFIEANE